MKKRAAIFLMAVLMAVTIMPAACASGGGATQKSPFTDVADYAWYYSCVVELSGQGVIDGYGDGSFRPGNKVTWGEAFKLILLSIGCEEPEAVPGEHWARPYIQLAVDNRMFDEFDSALLDAAPTRLALAQATARALGLTSISGESPYADCNDGYVVELYEKGIMEGSVDGNGVRRFFPEQTVTRAELAAVVWRVRNTDYTQGMFRYQRVWLDVLDIPLSSFTPEQFSRGANGRLAYSGGDYATGIDVSGHKGVIDWAAVAGDGIDFAIIRAGNRFYGKNGSGAVVEDGWFDRNMEGAIAAGLPVGAYLFSNAITVEEAIEEADLLIAKLEPYREHVSYPVVCDWEYLGGKNSRAYGVEPGVITQCVAAFCQRVEEAGYTPMVYFNTFCGYYKMDLSKLDRYGFWFAEYADAPSCIYDFQMWQYSCTGKVSGISSDVDMNLWFVPSAGPEPSVEPEPSMEPEESGRVELRPIEPGLELPTKPPAEPGPVRPSPVPM